MARRRPRIGTGSAFRGDRVAPALELAASGEVDYLVFDRLGESSMTNATLRMQKDPSKGYDSLVGRVVQQFGDYLSGGGVMVGSFGQANVEAAMAETLRAGRERGLKGVRVGAMHGGDVLPWLKAHNTVIPELGKGINDLGEAVICAHAYVGAEGFIDLLAQGAQFVLGGRIADASMAVAVMTDALGWSHPGWDQLAVGIMAGHMLQGGSGITGGGFADPPYRAVPGMGPLGFPYVVAGDETVTITKLPASGGMVTPETVKSRIGYEIHDPAAYLTPDVTVDLTQARVRQVAPDAIEMSGVRGRARPETLRALVGVKAGWRAIAENSMGGPGCAERAQLAETLIRERLKSYGDEIINLRIDIYGVSALFGNIDGERPPLNEVRLRVAAHCRSRAAARAVCEETGLVYFDRPAGIGGPKADYEEATMIYGVPVARDAVTIECEVAEI